LGCDEKPVLYHLESRREKEIERKDQIKTSRRGRVKKRVKYRDKGMGDEKTGVSRGGGKAPGAWASERKQQPRG